MSLWILLLASSAFAAITDVRVETSHTQAIIRYTVPDAAACSLKVADMNLPITISTASQSAGTVTVNTKLAHALSTSQTIYVEGTGVWDGWQTVVSTPTATSFTFSSGSAGSVAKGNVGTLVHDVNATLFSGADQDSRSALNFGRMRRVVVGRRLSATASDGWRYSRALQVYSRHVYTITCGGDTYDGSFVTGNIPLGNGNMVDWGRSDPSTAGRTLWPDFDIRGRAERPGNVAVERQIEPQSGLLYTNANIAGEVQASSALLIGASIATASGTNWTNPSNVLADDGNSATYSNAGKDILCVRPDRVISDYDQSADQAKYSVDQTHLSSMRVTLKGLSGAGATQANRDVEVALSADGCVTPITNWITISPSGSSADYSWPTGSSTPKAAFQDWVTAGATIPTRVHMFTAKSGGYLTTDGSSTVTLDSAYTLGFNSAMFKPWWTNGSKITIGAAGANGQACTGGTEYTITAFQNPRQITVSGTPGAGSNQSWCAKNFGIMVRKKSTSTDTITLQAVTGTQYTDVTNYPGDYTGTAKRLSEKTVNDGAGNPGYIYTSAIGGFWWVAQETGESRRISGSIVPARTDEWQGATCNMIENSFLDSDPEAAICGLPDPTGVFTVPVKVKFHWTGSTRWTHQSSSTVSMMTECSNPATPTPNPCVELTRVFGSSSVPDLIHDFTSSYDTSLYSSCSIRNVHGHYMLLYCLRSIQDTAGWIVVTDLSRDIANYIPGNASTNPVVAAVHSTLGKTQYVTMHAYELISDSAVMLTPKNGRDYGAEGCTPSGGSGTAYTCTTTSPATSYVFNGGTFRFKPDVTNTGAATININSLGALSIKKGAGVDVVAGDLPMGKWISLQYTNGSYMLVGNLTGAGPWVVRTSGDVAINDTTDVGSCPANEWGYTNTCTNLTITSEPFVPEPHYCLSPCTPETGAAGEYGNLQVGHTFQLLNCVSMVAAEGACIETEHASTRYEYARLLSKSGTAPNISITIARGIAPPGIRSMPSGTRLFLYPVSDSNTTPANPFQVWDFLTSPTGTGSISYGKYDNAHSACGKTGCMAPNDIGLSVWSPMNSTTNAGEPTNLSPVVYPTFNAKAGIKYPNTIENYLSNTQTDLDTTASYAKFAINSRPMFYIAPSANESESWSLIGGTTYLYKMSQFQSNPDSWPWHQGKVLPRLAYWGATPLLNVSGPSSSLADTAGDNYKFCVVRKANECRSGSKPHEVYANLPYVNKVGQSTYTCGQFTLNDDADICTQIVDPFVDGNIQYFFGLHTDMRLGQDFRKLGSAFSNIKRGAYQIPKVFPDGKWLGPLTSTWGPNRLRTADLFAKLPPQPASDSVNRLQWVPVPVSVGTAPTGTSVAVVEFGYDDFSDPANGKYYCGERLENCLAVSSTIPIPFATDTTSYSWTASGSSPVTITASGGHRLGADSKVGTDAGPSTITITGSTTFTIDGSTTVPAAGSTYIKVFQEDSPYLYPSDGCTVSGATNASPIEITCQNEHKMQTGNRVYIASVGGNTAANGYFAITRTGPAAFTLDGSTGNGAYTSGGTVVPGGVSCSSGCTVTIPTKSSAVLYYRWKFYNASNTLIGTSQPEIIVTP